MRYAIFAVLALTVVWPAMAAEDHGQNHPANRFEAELQRRAAEQGVTVEELLARDDASADVAKPALAGRYQMVSAGDSGMVWVLDTSAGLLRVCMLAPSKSKSEDLAENFAVDCSGWTSLESR